MTDAVQPPLAEDPAPFGPCSSWTDLECWVWEQIRAGDAADIDRHLDDKFDPEQPGASKASRRLRASFLQAIALQDPYRSALTRNGIQILGAWFDEPIDFRDGHLTRVLWLHGCRFEKIVRFNGLRSTSVMSFEGSVFNAKVDMRSLEVEGGLYLRRGARFKAVDLYGARVGRNTNFSHAVFEGRLIMNAVQIGGNLIGFESHFHSDVGFKGATVSGMMDIRRCTFEDRLDMWWLRTGQDLLMGGMSSDEKAEKRAHYQLLDCRNAKIGGQLDLNHVEIEEPLNLSSVTIVNGALLGCGSRFDSIDLSLARIGQNLVLTSAQVAGAIDLTAAEIGQEVSFCETSAAGDIDLVFAKLESNLDLCGGHYQKLDLTGTSIAGELRLDDRVTWSRDAEFILRNTSTNALHDSPKAWPKDIELDGFVYHRFGGHNADADSSLRKRGSAWFVEWLADDVPHTPQPYRQCAKVLNDMGHPEMADDVLYAGRERDRKEMLENGDYLSAVGLWLLRSTIGYGHGALRYFRTLNWAAGLTALGVLVLMLTGDHTNLDGNVPIQTASAWEHVINIVQAASYSLNKLLPIIDLPVHHHDVKLGTFGKLYFQAHKLAGYILALFLLAGITGLTK